VPNFGINLTVRNAGEESYSFDLKFRTAQCRSRTCGVQVVQVNLRMSRSTHIAIKLRIGHRGADEPASTSSVEATTTGNLLSAGRCSQQDGGYVLYS